jgi:hypothetical protein
LRRSNPTETNTHQQQQLKRVGGLFYQNVKKNGYDRQTKSTSSTNNNSGVSKAPLRAYIVMSMIRAKDLALTNLSMRHFELSS